MEIQQLFLMAMEMRQRKIWLFGREVLFTPSMKLTTTKDEFLSCQGNKSRFIKQLGNHLEQKGYEIMHAQGDADLLIV